MMGFGMGGFMFGQQIPQSFPTRPGQVPTQSMPTMPTQPGMPQPTLPNMQSQLPTLQMQALRNAQSNHAVQNTNQVID